jgi:hypothetical protein
VAQYEASILVITKRYQLKHTTTATNLKNYYCYSSMIFKDKHLVSPNIIEHEQSKHMQLLTTQDTNYLTYGGTQVLIAPFLAHLPFFTLRLYKITQETISLKRHKLCVLPLKLCIKYLNDLHFAHSSILRTRGDHNISWSRHNLSISSQGDTNWIDDIILLVTSGNNACLKIYNILRAT